jgi:pimeloyl-ACP methyl ester carboxylesterase
MKRTVFTAGVMVLTVALGGCSLIEPALTGRMSVTDPVERSYALQPRTIMVEEVSMNYMEAGEGPHVILLHGGVVPMSMINSFFANPFLDAPSIIIGYVPLAQSVMHSGAVTTADTWNQNIEALATGFHVVAPDLPGFGGSDKPDINYDLMDFVIYLDAFMRAKGIDKAMIVGHGLGGEIAIAYALEHPEKAEKLVLVDSFGAYGASAKRPFLKKSPLNLPRVIIKPWQDEKAAKTRFWLTLMRKIYGGWELPAKGAVNMTVSPDVKNDTKNKSKKLILRKEGASEEFIQYLAEYKTSHITTKEARKEIKAAHLALMETRRKDLGPRLSEIEVPVLIIRGAFDPIVDERQASYMEDMCVMSQFIEYEGSSHYPMLEEAERFNRDVYHFLSGSRLASSKDQ